jgi:hypothetical protein
MSLQHIASLPRRMEMTGRADRFVFDLATPDDNEELLRFCARADMAGAIRFRVDRSPHYFAALRVEGRHSDVIVGRDRKNGRIVATGHRSVKHVFVNGCSTPVGYLSALRVDPAVRSARFLAAGFAQLKDLQARHPASLHLTTIMEDNSPALRVLSSGRLGLPQYRDLGRFCCMALALRVRSGRCPRISVRRARAGDAPMVVAFLNHEGRNRQFFPVYQAGDFGGPGGLLPHLEWGDVFLAFHGTALVGTLAAWNQTPLRRWRVAGYAPWIGWSRHLVNVGLALCRMPLLPRPGASVDCCILALACIRDDDRDVFRTLLNEVAHACRDRFACCLAGLHECDPLLPGLRERPHLLLASRVHRVDWDKAGHDAGDLDGRVPWLETGSL